MIRIEGKFAEKAKEVRYMIDYLVKNHPLPNKVVVIKPIYRNKVKCYDFDASAYIKFSDTPEIIVKLCVGPKRMALPAAVALSIAHEYCHALQVYRDGKIYRQKQDKTLEKEAEQFAHKAMAGVIRLMITNKDF